MRLIDDDECPALFDAEFKETKRLILEGENHLDNLAEGFMEAHDAAPVVHGRWVDAHHSTSSCKCTICGAVYVNETTYCPNCGAKMDLPEKESTQ